MDDAEELGYDEQRDASAEDEDAPCATGGEWEAARRVSCHPHDAILMKIQTFSLQFILTMQNER